MATDFETTDGRSAHRCGSSYDMRFFLLCGRTDRRVVYAGSLLVVGDDSFCCIYDGVFSFCVSGCTSITL